jgi:hypothetical protein
MEKIKSHHHEDEQSDRQTRNGSEIIMEIIQTALRAL